MRYFDESDKKTSYTPLKPAQMVRVALVNGLNRKKYDEKEVQRYKRLIRDYSKAPRSRLGNLISLANTKRNNAQQRKLDFLVNRDFNYYHGKWDTFDYDKLKKEGIVIEHKGDVKSLVELMLSLPENKVVHYTGHVAEPDKDYIKHVSTWNKFCLNSPEVVKEFSARKGLTLPESYIKSGRLTNDVLDKLAFAGFTFTEALRSAFNIIGNNPRYKNRKISTLYVKNPATGNEARFHHHDWIQAAERFIHYKMLKEKTDLDFKDPDKYVLKSVRIPKTVPIRLRTGEMKTHNRVEVNNLPDLQEVDEKNCLRWMYYTSRCDCDHDIDLRNFRQKSGNKIREVTTQDFHGGQAILNLLWRLNQQASKSPNNPNPIPSPEFSEYIDRFRYQLFETFERPTKDLKIYNIHDYVKQAALDILANELLKQEDWNFDRMYYPNEKIQDFILRDMYDFRENK